MANPPMRQQPLDGMGRAFVNALALDGDVAPETRRSVEYEFERVKTLLPESGDAWTTCGRGKDATLMLLAEDTLFTLTREDEPDRGRHVVVTSWPARITQVRYLRNDQETFWKFGLRDRDPVEIQGRLNFPAQPAARRHSTRPRPSHAPSRGRAAGMDEYEILEGLIAAEKAAGHR